MLSYLVCLVFVYSSYSSTSLNYSGVLELVLTKIKWHPPSPKRKAEHQKYQSVTTCSKFKSTKNFYLCKPDYVRRSHINVKYNQPWQRILTSCPAAYVVSSTSWLQHSILSNFWAFAIISHKSRMFRTFICCLELVSRMYVRAHFSERLPQLSKLTLHWTY